MPTTVLPSEKTLYKNVRTVYKKERNHKLHKGNLMSLEKYLAEKKLTYTAFAKRAGVSRVTVMKWATSQIMPRPKHISIIFEATAGNVTLQDLYATYMDDTR